jgi:predicted ester cyclase
MTDDVAAENKRLEYHIFEQMYDKRNMDVIDEYIDENWVDHYCEVMRPGEAFTRADLKKLTLQSFEAFPDSRTVIDDMVAEGDRVAVRFTVTGTHTGADFMGMPANGKIRSMHMMVIDRYRDGKIVESWGVVEALPVPGQDAS